MEDLAGNTLDSRYVLRRAIGSGVYEAEDTASKRLVAIRMLAEATADDARRAAQESNAVASEHIVPIVEVGRDARFGFYVVTDLLNGEDLATRLLKVGGRLPIADAIALGVQAARALAKAHAAGVVHGALSPEKMFLTTREDGSPCLKILELGIAHLSGSGAMYMSPERAAGRRIDARADLWSLGAVLYETLSGREPWEWTPTFELLLAKIARELPAPLAQVAPWIPAAVAGVIESVLVHDRERRPDAGTFADALLEAARTPAPSSQMRVAPGTYAPGHVVHGYRILGRLRAGGMATLFLAAREGAAGFSRPVAIKMIHPHLASDPEHERMFVEEARLLARIVHPNVVHVEELIEHEGSLHLVMEYVEGCSLAQLSSALVGAGRRFLPEVAAYIAMQVASGLHAAHEARGENGEPLGIVHRDVSPQNVLVARQGHMKLIDFGIAKARGGDRSTEGSLRGKIGYMAPEQAWGRPIDRRTDVYALGVILWEMLTGRRLFDGANEFALLEKVRSPNVVPPLALVPDIPHALSDVVMRALAPDPAHRPPTANDLRRMLADAAPAALAIEPEAVAKLVALVVADNPRLTRIVRETIGAGSPRIATLTMRSVSGEEEALQTMSLAAPAAHVRPRTDPRIAAGIVFSLGAVVLIAAFASTRKAPPPAPSTPEVVATATTAAITTVSATATETATVAPPSSTASGRRSPPRRPPPQQVSSRAHTPEPAKSGQSSVQMVEGLPIVEPAH